VVPPADFAPRQAASIAPPRPPHTTTAPRSARARPTASAISASRGSAREGPTTATWAHEAFGTDAEPVEPEGPGTAAESFEELT